MTGMTPQEHALRVAVLEALSVMVDAEYQAAREDAQEAFAAVRRAGIPQQEVLLPDGTRIGKISIKDGPKAVTADDDALMAWAREHNPDAIESYIDPSALRRPDVIEVIRGKFPELVGTRVREATRRAYLKEAEKDDSGRVVAEDGSYAVVADITRSPATGAFGFTGGGADLRRDRIAAEWQAGRLPEIALGGLPGLPQGGES